MTEVSSSSDLATGDKSADTEDQEFEPSAEMLVYDFDDEQTMAEEEALGGENVEEELTDLQKEVYLTLKVMEDEGRDVQLEFRSLIEEIATHTNQVREKVKALSQQIADDPPNVNKGLSILEVKYHAFLEYLIGITYGMIIKVNGMSLQKNSLIDLIVENRTIIERIRPIEQKLKYQMDKVLKAARGDLSADDPLRFKANPDLLVTKGEASSEEELSEGEEEDRQKSDSKHSVGTYVPPKLVSMPYEGDLSLAEKKAQKEARIKRHLMTSTLLQELKEEYTDAPIELVDTDDIIKAKQHKRAKEKQESVGLFFYSITVS
ncbi:hypothetical protein QYM36_001049 [Artemia franciscana]|uniref:Uncharacterized protein n=2 Tax=Artemia franciscana TaxID=6661 RepID=A0AA88ID14_ARTSF|nr:hypothetical protein QYM36_001049 [Artemia franciscana]